MYDRSDPRSTLTAPAPAAAACPIAPLEALDFTRLAPDEISAAGSRTWIVRGQNVVVAHTRPVTGDPLEPTDLPTEQVIVLPLASSAVRVTWGGGSRDVRGPGIVIVPPGPATLVALAEGDLIRLVDALTPGWPERARNAASYCEPQPRVAPLEYWPEPVGPPRLRVHLLADDPPEPGRFGHIYRTRAFMVNVLPVVDGPRDRTRLSPHHHDDFQQLSIAVAGTFVHHVRTPWGPDATAWRPDDHVSVGSPSVAVIPPPTVHTTEATGAGRHVLIDVFSPPRHDFSDRPGWVLNAADYPQPDVAQ